MITWRKLESARRWRPAVGDRLTGFYLGRVQREGQFGVYELVTLAVPDDEGLSTPYEIGGVQATNLITANGIAPGRFLTIEYTGTRETKAGRTMHTYEVFVAVETVTEAEAAEYLQQLEGAS